MSTRWIVLGVIVVLTVGLLGYNILYPVNRQARQIADEVSAEDVEFVTFDGESGFSVTRDPRLIEEVLDGLAGARLTIYEGFASNCTGRMYLVLKNRQKRYSLQFDARKPASWVSGKFARALEQIRAQSLDDAQTMSEIEDVLESIPSASGRSDSSGFPPRFPTQTGSGSSYSR